MTTTKSPAKIVDVIKEEKQPSLHFKIISLEERVQLKESINKSEIAARKIIKQLKDPVLREGKESLLLRENLMNEAIKIERLMIMEAVSHGDFHDMKNHFNSLLGAVTHIIGDFDGTDVADTLYDLRQEGLELLNELIEYIMDLEDRYSGKGSFEPKLDSHLKKVRNDFVTVFTDLSIIIKGMVSLSNAVTQEDGYNDLMGVLASIKRSGAGEKTLLVAMREYDASMGVKTTKRKQGILDKLFGKAGPKGLLAKFKEEVVKALGTSPGFRKLVDVNDFVNHLLRQTTVDKLMQSFKTLEHIIANEVDVEFILKMTQEPKGVWNTIKSMLGGFNAGIGGGGVGSAH